MGNLAAHRAGNHPNVAPACNVTSRSMGRRGALADLPVSDTSGVAGTFVHFDKSKEFRNPALCILPNRSDCCSPEPRWRDGGPTEQFVRRAGLTHKGKRTRTERVPIWFVDGSRTPISSV